MNTTAQCVLHSVHYTTRILVQPQCSVLPVLPVLPVQLIATAVSTHQDTECDVTLCTCVSK